MKHLLLAISVFCSINCLAQDPNPDLFQTWYLYSVYASDGSDGYIVSEIEPAITPTLTIMENLTFNGVGACNTFNGTFNIPYPNTLETDQFSSSSSDCGVQIHNFFESEYFDFMQLAAGYSMSSVDNGLVLTMGTPVFGQAVFKNFKLSTVSFDLNQVEIYPNPTHSLIYIESKNSPVIKIELFDLLGQSIKTIKSQFDIIDVSDLSNGVYIMKIDTELGTLSKKVVKE